MTDEKPARELPVDHHCSICGRAREDIDATKCNGCWSVFTHATKASVTAWIQALSDDARAEVLAPFVGELGELLLAEQGRRHKDAFARVDAEERATIAEARVAELESEIASRKRAARERVTAEELGPDEALARIAEMEKRT